MGAMFIFAYLAFETLYRAKKGLGSFNVPGERNNIQRAAIGLGVASFWIIVRCIYRTVELAQGWTGYLITVHLSKLLESLKSANNPSYI